MGIITLLTLSIFVFVVHLAIRSRKAHLDQQYETKLRFVKEGGLLTLVVVVFLTSLGLYSGFLSGYVRGL